MRWTVGSRRLCCDAHSHHPAGYIQGDPRKRMPGSILSLIPMLGLLGTATTAVYQLANTHGLGLF